MNAEVEPATLLKVYDSGTALYPRIIVELAPTGRRGWYWEVSVLEDPNDVYWTAYAHLNGSRWRFRPAVRDAMSIGFGLMIDLAGRTND